MVAFARFPHVLHWTTPAGESTEDPNTGYTIPGAPGEDKQTPCRYEMDSSKEYKNEDNTTTQQRGNIFLAKGLEYPALGTSVVVMKLDDTVMKLDDTVMFSGTIKDVYPGQLGTKLEA